MHNPGSILMAACFACLAACTVESNDNPFGSASNPTSVGSVSSTTPVTTDTGSSETGGGSGESSTAAAETSSGGGETSSGTADPTLDSSEADSTGGADGTQPADGMYSSCAVANDCGFAPTLCITITDADMMLLGGFCSETGCANPAVDCAESPGGTAIPFCMMVTVNDVAEMACALDCSGGMTCPAPMMCRALADAMVCA